MANAFISPPNRISEAEDVGDGVQNELYKISFFGKVRSFKKHDYLVLDLAESVAEDVCCVTKDNGVTTV